MVFFEKIDGGGYRISRVLPCLASAAAAAAAIEAVNPHGFAPVDDTQGNTSAPPSAAEIAAADALRERVEALDGDELGLKAGEAV